MTDADGQVRPKRRLSRVKKWLLWSLGIALVLALAVCGVANYYLHRAEPMLRAALVDSLQKRFHSKVEIGDFRVSMLDGFWVEGRSLRIWLPVEAQQNAIAVNGAANQPWITGPWIVVDKLRFHASWHISPGQPIVVNVIHVEGVKVLLPPKEDRLNLSGSKSAGAGQAAGLNPNAAGPAGTENAATQPQAEQAPPAPVQPTATNSWLKLPRVVVKQIECQNAELIIEKGQRDRDKGKIPLDFFLSKATLFPDNNGGPISFAVELTNAKPVGLIHSTGKAGPWVPGDPGELPVEGDYHFDHADLSTIKGIAGMLSSTGHYSGTLRKIEVDGQTQTPDFRLQRVADGSGVPLTAHFHATVDGTNGDTWLEPVDAMLGHTHILARGKVVRVPEVHGHDITLQVNVDRGRIEDILHISASSETPFMTGNLSLATSFHLPPGEASVWDKLLLDGQFHLSQARFSNDKMQGRIVQLSLRGQGKPDEVKTTDPTTVRSDMQGHFKLGGGMLQLPDLQYQVPGAQIVAHGTYGLKAGSLDFDGDAKLDASLSQVIGGWKGFLLKPADKLLSKNGAGLDVPIHVKGTRKDPKFGVDFDRLGKTQKAAQQ
ncbi:AsmA-like C-terminal region-containing protein [Acidicapsa ligni]|uniref:AsmA-like C-terminal region-containing protein n=1 Tax=Acidicapsa ligni TaxID=542300 RepID=UPI0021E09187|nr:AsmA-like C-terminal region-containing protein [Acidicapsa ligni]